MIGVEGILSIDLGVLVSGLRFRVQNLDESTQRRHNQQSRKKQLLRRSRKILTTNVLEGSSLAPT